MGEIGPALFRDGSFMGGGTLTGLLLLIILCIVCVSLLSSSDRTVHDMWLRLRRHAKTGTQEEHTVFFGDCARRASEALGFGQQVKLDLRHVQLLSVVVSWRV